MSNTLNRSISRRPIPTSVEMANAGVLNTFAALNDVDGAKTFLSTTPDMDVNSADYDFRTPLHVAAASGSADMCDFLLEQGAQQRLDRFGGLPVHDAQRQNHFNIVNMLRETNPILPNQGVSAPTSALQEQMDNVFRLIVQQGVFSYGVISDEVDYFYNQMGLDAEYFKLFNAAQIAKHVHSLIAAKKVAAIGRDPENLCVKRRSTPCWSTPCWRPALRGRRTDLRSPLLWPTLLRQGDGGRYLYCRRLLICCPRATERRQSLGNRLHSLPLEVACTCIYCPHIILHRFCLLLSAICSPPRQVRPSQRRARHDSDHVRK